MDFRPRTAEELEEELEYLRREAPKSRMAVVPDLRPRRGWRGLCHDLALLVAALIEIGIVAVGLYVVAMVLASLAR